MKLFITALLSVWLLVPACQVKNQSNNIPLERSSSKVDIYTQNSKDKLFNFIYTDFESFYRKFSSDSIYQIAHVKFPVKGCYSDYDGDIEWTKDNWSFLRASIQDVIKERQDSIIVKQGPESFSFELYCIDCGFSFTMAFEKQNGGWYLTSRQDNNF